MKSSSPTLEDGRDFKGVFLEDGNLEDGSFNISFSKMDLVVRVLGIVLNPSASNSSSFTLKDGRGGVFLEDDKLWDGSLDIVGEEKWISASNNAIQGFRKMYLGEGALSNI